MTDLVPVSHPAPEPGGPTLPPARTGDVLSTWLAARNPRTLEAYSRDLERFRVWMGAPSAEAAVDVFLELGQAGANRIALAYRASMLERRLSGATIARRLAALRSMTKVARLVGRIAWSLDVEAPRVEPRRDMRGPDLVDVRLVWRAASAGDGPRQRRDRAILAMLFDLGLRRGELCGIDRADIEADASGRPSAVWILGKGRSEKERLSLPVPTVEALEAWLAARGDRPGPLFHRLDGGARSGRMSGESVRRIVGRLGRAAGLARPLRPHGLRHSAATSALDAGRDVRDVRKFTRHRSLEMVIRYDDQRRDVAGEIARALAGRRDAGR